MHAHGIPLKDLGVGQAHFGRQEARHAFELLGSLWPAFAGTPMRWWFEDSLINVFGIHERFGPETAGKIYDQINDLLCQPEFSTKELAKKFNIELISTTDDPTDSLAIHDAVNTDAPYKLAPAFRPDKYLEPSRKDWAESVDSLGRVSGVDTSTYEGFTAAMRERRLYFKEHGAVLSDHSHADIGSERLTDDRAEQLYQLALKEGISSADSAVLRHHMLNDQARLALEDGLVMTVHPGIYRNYDDKGLEIYGENIGADLPLPTEFTVNLRPILNAYSGKNDFHLVAFTVDESAFSLSLAPLAGYYEALYVGAPWWFLDQPEALMRYFKAAVPICGLGKLSGFIDDTRALCSIPSRHDMNRRITASFVAGLVSDGQLTMNDGLAVMKMIIQSQPQKVFKIESLGDSHD